LQVFTSYLEDTSEWLQDGIEETAENAKKRASTAHVLLTSFKQSYNALPEIPVFGNR
jgi:hypothetical protein